jgi:hypothetical protein
MEEGGREGQGQGQGQGSISSIGVEGINEEKINKNTARKTSEPYRNCEINSRRLTD